MYKLFKNISATCVSLIASILFLDYNYSLLGINTIFLLLYVILVFFASIWATFMFLQRCLATSTPFTITSNKLLSLLNTPVRNIKVSLAPKDLKDIDKRIQSFTQNIEKTCITPWYKNYISKNDQFLTESSKLIDIIVRRYLQIANQINSDKIMRGIIVILLRHVKEYKKAAKKAKVDGSVEGHYRYAHFASKNAKNFEHFTLQLTAKALKSFVHWELQHSLGCQILNAILARKVLGDSLHHFAAPGFLNYSVLNLQCLSFNVFHLRGNVSLSGVDHSKTKISNKQPEIDLDIVELDDQLDVEEVDFVDGLLPEKQTIVDIKHEQTKSSACEKQEKEVKVYESRSANKTWRNSSDLDCISLGQDILFLSGIAEEEKPDWNQLEKDFKKDFKKISNIHIGGTMKELQQTTSNAMHKFEDEAVGIFDLGMAGLRKGLRLTGLQDSTRPKDIPQSNKTNTKTRLALSKLSHVNSDEVSEIDDEKLANNKEKLLEKSSLTPSSVFSGDILLEKSPSPSPLIETRTSSNDSQIPTMEFLHVDSPEPEYEDNPDLETTTAKLRSLLATKTEANTPIASPMSLLPMLATPQDATNSAASGSSMDDLSEMDPVDGALPSMYKAWAKTATGVFHNTLNTIKTALPGNANEDALIALNANFNPVENFTINLNGKHSDSWVFVENELDDEDDFGYMLEKFLAERQEYCTVEHAYEAVEAVDVDMQSTLLHDHNERKFDLEELDELDMKIPISKALVDLVCELIEETFPPLVKENIVKTFLLTFGAVLEEKLQLLGRELIKCIGWNIGNNKDDEMAENWDKRRETIAMSLDELVEPLVKALSNKTSLEWFDAKSLTAILSLLMESLQSHKINVDTALQLVELFVAEVIAACGQSSPTYSVFKDY